MIDLEKNLPAASTKWNFKYVSPQDVIKIIEKAPNKEAIGPDGISLKFLKKIKLGIADNLSRLINTIIANKSYPKALVKARVKPIYKKKGSRDDPKNYRSVGLVNSIAKIIDIALFKNQAQVKIENVLTDNIFGYRVGLNTEDALVHLKERIIQESSRGHKVAIVNCDAKAAFNAVPHELILEGFRRSGAEKKSEKIIESYLREQKQYVQVKDSMSEEWSNINSGIFQGVHLAGTAYNVATLGHSSQQSVLDRKSVKYGDDESIVVSASNKTELVTKIHDTIEDKKRRFTSSGMRMEEKKT